jgi:type IV pilus assembly protein PilB
MVTITSGAQATPQKKQKQLEALDRLAQESLEEGAARLAHNQGLLYIDLSLMPVKASDVLLMPESESRRLGAGVFHFENDLLYVALTTITPEALATFEALAHAQTATPRFYVVSERSIQKVWSRYQEHSLIQRIDQMQVNLHGEDLENFNKNFGALLELAKNGDRIPTTQAMETILAGALRVGSSDIHIEGGEKESRLRFRIDGELQDIGLLPNGLYHLITSRIKLLSKMKLNIRDRAQDGHFEIHVDQERTDIRVSIIPGQYGENINMRLLTGADAFVQISTLGMRHSVLEQIKKQIVKPNGLILNTGPTGSGKTTTLYSLLNSINSSTLKIITVEDPIEYRLPGIVQTEVTERESVTHQTAGGTITGNQSGYTFADALRAIVRQDPDVILVGEIRDGETAHIALNASLTGHLVFSTLHTNDAPASIVRLRELGVTASLISSAVNIFIAQRLVRTLCEHCKKSYIPAEKTKAAFLHILSNISPSVKESIPTEVDQLYLPVGCSHCNLSGYKGRLGVYEIFPITESMSLLLNKDPEENEIRKLARKEGMLTLIEDGVLKCLEGLTTLEEVVHHTGIEESLEQFYKDILEGTSPLKDSQEKTL